MSDISYTIFRKNELYDCEFKTKDEAIEWIDETFADECADRGYNRGEEDIFIVKRYWDDEKEEWLEVERTPHELYWRR